MVCAGCSPPVVTSFCMVVMASLRTLPRSCSGKVRARDLLSGAAECASRVLFEVVSKF